MTTASLGRPSRQYDRRKTEDAGRGEFDSVESDKAISDRATKIEQTLSSIRLTKGGNLGKKV